ncbi:hypothetical protein ACS0TY_017731 [Phlomoides rotata]
MTDLSSPTVIQTTGPLTDIASPGGMPPLKALNTTSHRPLKLTFLSRWNPPLSANNYAFCKYKCSAPNLVHKYWGTTRTSHPLYHYRATWDILATTYGKPTRDRIITLKSKLHNPTKGDRSITDYMFDIKSMVDELSLLGVLTDHKDLTLKAAAPTYYYSPGQQNRRKSKFQHQAAPPIPNRLNQAGNPTSPKPYLSKCQLHLLTNTEDVRELSEAYHLMI